MRGHTAPRVRNFFTVGAALSIGPVKFRLRTANKDGRKPASVRRWINLDAHGDIVGGAPGPPFTPWTTRFLNLSPFGCQTLLGLVNPQCAPQLVFPERESHCQSRYFCAFD